MSNFRLRELAFLARRPARLQNHVNVDRTHKLIRRNAVTDAAVHDSGKLDGLLHRGNTLQDGLETAPIARPRMRRLANTSIAASAAARVGAP